MSFPVAGVAAKNGVRAFVYEVDRNVPWEWQTYYWCCDTCGACSKHYGDQDACVHDCFTHVHDPYHSEELHV